MVLSKVVASHLYLRLSVAPRQGIVGGKEYMVDGNFHRLLPISFLKPGLYSLALNTVEDVGEDRTLYSNILHKGTSSITITLRAFSFSIQVYSTVE
jgi:hypothetical protein